MSRRRAVPGKRARDAALPLPSSVMLEADELEELAHIRARDAACDATWFHDPSTAAAHAMKDRRRLLGLLDRVRSKSHWPMSGPRS